MNIPEITNAARQETRSESVTHAKPVDKSKVREDTLRGHPKVVDESDVVQNEKEASALSREELDALIKEVEERFEKNDVSLKFNVLEEDDTVQVEIVDGDGKTIRKIPDDDMVKLSKSLKNFDGGILDKIS